MRRRRSELRRGKRSEKECVLRRMPRKKSREKRMKRGKNVKDKNDARKTREGGKRMRRGESDGGRKRTAWIGCMIQLCVPKWVIKGNYHLEELSEEFLR
jgi:hypothetical protein